jgi:uncharacterized protein YbjT (DUF2867 family)
VVRAIDGVRVHAKEPGARETGIRSGRAAVVFVITPVFVTGGTGYLGRPLVAALLARGCDIHALVRPGSEARLPNGARPIVGDAQDETTFASEIPAGAAVVHLIGTTASQPVYAILRCVPSTRDTAIRLGLVTRRAMVAALLQPVVDPPENGTRIVSVPEIAAASSVTV